MINIKGLSPPCWWPTFCEVIQTIKMIHTLICHQVEAFIGWNRTTLRHQTSNCQSKVSWIFSRLSQGWSIPCLRFAIGNPDPQHAHLLQSKTGAQGATLVLPVLSIDFLTNPFPCEVLTSPRIHQKYQTIHRVHNSSFSFPRLGEAASHPRPSGGYVLQVRSSKSWVQCRFILKIIEPLNGRWDMIQGTRYTSALGHQRNPLESRFSSQDQLFITLEFLFSGKFNNVIKPRPCSAPPQELCHWRPYEHHLIQATLHNVNMVVVLYIFTLVPESKRNCTTLCAVLFE